MTSAETVELAEVAEKVLAMHWGRPAWAASADLDALWSAAATCGWFELDGSLEAALALVQATGRFACPLPILDAFIAAEVLAERADLLVAIAVAAVRVVLATPAAASCPLVEADASGPLVEAGAVATHVLELPRQAGLAVLRPVVSAEPVPGLPAPPWYRVELAEPVACAELGADAAGRAGVLRRLGLAARALAAANRAHDLALAHAKVRRQFGKAVGAFGAVQQRLVDSRLELTGAGLLIAEAGRRYRTPDWPAAAQLAVANVSRVAPRVQLAAHHTLAATGYYEEHDAPWLFRRVHADLAWLPVLSPPGTDVAATLLDGADLPDPLLTPAADAARTRFRNFLADCGPLPEATVGGGDHPATVAAIGAAGWLTAGWPASAGGRDAGADELAAVQQEVFRHRVPVTAALAAATTVGAAIARHGTPAQRARFLPPIARGELPIAVGYSEPEAGSDLAALRTRATRDGEDWVITGQKAWASDGHRARYIWLAVRTNPDATPPQAGITMFLVPASAPGIRMRPDVALSGQVACRLSFDAVRVPDAARIGPVDGGWRVLSDALGSERILLGGIAATAHRQLADLVTALGPGARSEAIRIQLTDLAARVQAARLLVVASSSAANGGRPATELLASAAKVQGSELAEDLAAASLTMLGPAVALSGPLERSLVMAPGNVIAGGTNDIHRSLIARALGLPT